MVNRLVSVDESNNLPLEVWEHLVGGLQTEFAGAVETAESAATDSEYWANVAQQSANPSPGLILPLSNGVDDHAPIQAILDSAAGRTVYGRSGETYIISEALVVRSNTVLDMTGCRIEGNPIKNVMKNYAANPARTVTGASTTAGSTTITATGANFTSDDVGKPLGVLAAGPNYGLSSAPGMLYGTVVSVTNPTTVIISQPATLTTSGSTLYVYPDRDTDIEVRGGVWVGGNKDSVGQQLDSHGFLLRRIDGIVLRDFTYLSTGTSGIGGRYGISMGDFTNLTCDNIQYDCAGDGIHIQGPAARMSITNQFGKTGDDMVAITGVDGQSQANSRLGDVEGDVFDVSIVGVFPRDAWTALRIISGTGTNNQQRILRGYHAKNIQGTVRNESVVISNYAGISDVSVVVEGVSTVSTQTNKSMIVNTASKVRNLTIRDVEWLSSNPATAGIIRINAAVENMLVEGIRVKNPTLSDVSTVLLASANIVDLTMKNIHIDGELTESYCFRSTQTNAVYSNISIDNLYRVCGSGNIVQMEGTGYTVGTLNVSNGYSSTGSVFSSAVNSSNKMILNVSNFQAEAGAVCILTCPATVGLSNVRYATPSGGLVRSNSATADPVRVLSSNVDVGVSPGTLVSKTATQSVSASGTSGSVNVALLTGAQPGDIAMNSNAALSIGVGLAVRGPSNWKNLYSGTTY